MATDPENVYDELWSTPAPVQAQPTDRGVVIVNPAVREQQRAEQSQAMEAERLGLSQAGELRAGRQETRTTLENLRKEYRGLPAVEDYENAITNYAAGLRTAPNGSGDLTLVYNFAKIVDPSSVVQQGEMENIQTTDARLPAAVQNALRQLRLSDGVFTDEAREGLRREMHNLISQRNLAYRAARDQYSQLALSPEYGVNPDLVIGQHAGTPFREQISEYWAAQQPAQEPQEEEEAARVSGTGDFMTAEDRELLGRIQSAYNAGAPIEELQAITAEYGRTFPISTQEALDAARREGRNIGVLPSGRRNVAEETLGGVAESPVGAYFVGATNALLSGGMDEIGNALGMDAETIQLSKEQLRNDYPVSSFAGEASGQALQFALTRRAGVPTQYQPAAEVVQGAAYGFGEANEDRLTGAAFGAGGAVVGQQVAQRLIEPGIQAIIQRISRDTGAPREVVEQLVEESFGGGAARQAMPEVPPVGGAVPEMPPSPPAGAAPPPAAAAAAPEVPAPTTTPPRASGAGFESVDDIIADAAERNVRLDISQNARGITLNIIDTTQAGRNQGLGTEFMQRLVDAADRSGQRIMLTPDTSFGGSSVRRLEDFYSRFGFVPNRGRNKDFEISAAMYREPSPRARVEVPPTPTPTPTPTPPRAPSVAEQQGISEEMVALARRAAGRGPGSSAARAELREAIEADPTLIQQAEALGLELPADVFSANVQLRNLAGLARSQPGSAAEASWQQIVSNSAQQVEQSLAEMGASRDLAGLSDEVFTRLNSNMQSLQRQGDELREAVNANLNMQSRVNATNLQEALAETINDLGGIEEATQAMTAQERRLLQALGVGEEARQPTYAYMDRLRREIGDALNNGSGPWADTERVTLQRYYNALAQDRIDHVARELGQQAADDLAASNQIFQAMYAARDEMTNLFGRDLDKGIGRQIESIVSQGARGDITNLRRMMSLIPEDMRSEVAFSGILANARFRGAEGGFGFRQFNDIYRGIRQNAPVYRELARNMTESQRTFLDNLYAISQGIADADNRIIRTGRARGGPAEEINAQSLTQKIVEQATRRGVGAGTGMLGGTLLGDVTMGIPAAVALESGLAYLGRGSASNLDRVSEVIGSAAYRDLVNEAGRGGNMTRAINRLANSRPFGLFARGLGLNTQDARRAWIRSALAVGATQQVGGEPAQADSQAIMVEAQQ